MRIHSPLLTAFTVSSLTLGVSLLNLAPTQASSLLGSTVNYTIDFPNLGSLDAGSFTVSNDGPEVNYSLGYGNDAWTVDFGASSFDLGIEGLAG